MLQESAGTPGWVANPWRRNDVEYRGEAGQCVVRLTSVGFLGFGGLAVWRGGRRQDRGGRCDFWMKRRPAGRGSMGAQQRLFQWVVYELNAGGDGILLVCAKW